MITIYSIILSVIFTLLGFIHIYWFFNGKRGLSFVIPSKPESEANLKIPKGATILVAVLLLFFGMIYFTLNNFSEIELPRSMTRVFLWVIPIVFFLRGVGDFKYVGIFKKIKGTEFSKMDYIVFSPLCFIIAALGLSIVLN